jgi:NOL1/NOP2/sun family putative RNA methylase
VSLPEVFAQYLELVDDPQAFFASLSRPLPTTLWVNTWKTTELALVDYFRQEGLELEPLSWYPGGFRLRNLARAGATLPFVAGWYYLQEEVAMTAVVALDPQPGEKVVDLCASPGGKTGQIALRVGPSGLVVANEAQMARLSALRASVDRLGLLNVVTTWADGRFLPLPEGLWDRVLLDAPCSGEGTVRKSKAPWRPVSPPFRKALVALQKALLRKALRLVKPGGVVVYSTCTFSPEENEAVLHEVLGDWGVVEPVRNLGLRYAPGLTRWQGQSFRQDLANACRFWPHLNDTGGFFLARIVRTPEPMPPETTGKPRDALFRPAEESPLLEFCQRFGCDRRELEAFRFWQKGGRVLWLSFPACQPPPSAPVEAVGIPFLHLTHRGFKPKTFALQYLAPLLRKGVVELPDVEAAKRFVAGQSQNFAVPGEEPGYVLVRFGPFALGCGLLARGQLHSQIPKGLQLEIASSS